MSNLLGLEEEKPEGAGSQYDDVEIGPDPELAARAKSGANWFYWIAALSVINGIAFVAGANYHFLAGLGLTEIADAVIAASIEQGASSALRFVSLIFNLILVISFALIGYFAGKFFKTAFLLGIVAYLVDALVVLLIGDYFMAGFHAFALFFIIRGFLACRELTAYHQANKIVNVPPPPPPDLT